MRLIGMLDSPYVRRVAIALRMLDIPFTHEPLSVFRDFDRIAAINPIVKVPTLVVGDGTALSDSTLILDYLERSVPAGRRLTPAAPADFLASQQIVGIALAACEKSVQIVYERNLRPAEKQHQPWLDRVASQLHAAYALLEARFAEVEGWRFGDRPSQADVTTAVAWRFSRETAADVIAEERYPALAALSRRAEATAAFAATPLGG